MTQSRFIIITLSFLFIYSCKSETKEAEHESTATAALVNKTPVTADCPQYIMDNKNNNLNVSVFLDLSDRITQPKAISRDVEYINSIANAFVNHVKTKQLILLEDKIQLFFNPLPNSEIDNIAKNLQIQFTKDTPKSQIENTLKLYREEPMKLYELAKKDASNPNDFVGSDIWSFFKYNVKNYTISNCHRNILVILTDGYMYHKNTQMQEGNKTSYLTPKSLSKMKLNNSQWSSVYTEGDYGFIPATNDLGDLEVLVLGVNNLNEDNPYSLDILHRYWSEWFEAMGVKHYKIQNADLAASVEGVIENFVN